MPAGHRLHPDGNELRLAGQSSCGVRAVHVSRSAGLVPTPRHESSAVVGGEREMNRSNLIGHVFQEWRIWVLKENLCFC